jgi:GNAT superfamily N-acetyltransferase
VSFTVAAVTDGREALAREILEELPEWFGIPEATEAYVKAADKLPMLAYESGGKVIGFLTLKLQTIHAMEIVVMGVRRAWHRRGAGRALMAAAEAEAVRRGCSYVTVRTLAPSNPDPNYVATRAFYEALGFVPVEILSDLWGPDLPSLLLLKRVGRL